MTRVHEGKADVGFNMPESIEVAQVCHKSGLLPNPGVCELDPRGNAVYTEYFEAGKVPTEICTHHVLTTICSESGGAATEFCPEETKIQSAAMIVPENELGETDDSLNIQPQPCTLHTEFSSPLPSDGDENQESGGSNPSGNIGPGYVGPGYVGPGYTSPGSSTQNSSQSPGFISPNYTKPGYIKPNN